MESSIAANFNYGFWVDRLINLLFISGSRFLCCLLRFLGMREHLFSLGNEKWVVLDALDCAVPSELEK